MNNASRHPRTQDGLTRIELLAILAALALLAAITLPALAGGRPRSETAVCANNLRQLGVAALGYSLENGGRFPPRATTNSWPVALAPRIARLEVLRCPADPVGAYPWPTNYPPAFRAPRSYLINGWNDYFQVTLSSTEWQSFQNHQYPFGMPEAAVPLPAQTILFGEKRSDSLHLHMDFNQGIGNDIDVVEHARHGDRRAGAVGGGSNHAMVDGSVRMLTWGQAVAPTNLWAVIDLWRTNSIAVAP
jgi:type II secretory pathway pseudopilin PulG